MSRPDGPSDELIGRTADSRMLDAGGARLPPSLSRPARSPAPERRSLVLAAGVAMAGLTLIGGLALAILGVVALLSGAGLVAAGELCAGILLCATHWGWVHVAAWRNDRVADRRNSGAAGDERAWLDTIEPYTRYEVTTRVGDDGALTIETVRYQPTPSGSRHFSFQASPVEREVHPSDAPAALISERAELARRSAAELTAQERRRYEAACERREAAALAARDEQDQLEVGRAAAQALSEQLNTKLREPPLTG